MALHGCVVRRVVGKVLKSSESEVLVEYESQQSTKDPSLPAEATCRESGGGDGTAEPESTHASEAVLVETANGKPNSKRKVKVRERVALERVRPLPPRTHREFRPASGQAVQVLERQSWRAAIIKAVRRKGEQLLDDDKFFLLRREQASLFVGLFTLMHS